MGFLIVNMIVVGGDYRRFGRLTYTTAFMSAQHVLHANRVSETSDSYSALDI